MSRYPHGRPKGEDAMRYHVHLYAIISDVEASLSAVMKIWPVDREPGVAAACLSYRLANQYTELI